jgi:hypothetical protein
MGANPTQATGVALLFIAFTLIAFGLAADTSVIALLAGVASLGASIVLFLKAKSWEQAGE